jgi:rhodanese-related sulfurtransferase
VLVDTRPDSDHERLWIPGAIHLRGAALRSAGYLRDKTVVLIGGAADAADSEVTCARLAQSGFRSVHALRGGIAAWARAGGELEGDDGARARASHVSADVFARDAARTAWLLVDTARVEPTVAPAQSPRVELVSVPLSLGETRFRAEFAKAVKERSARTPAPLVAVTAPDPKQLAAAERALAGAAAPDLVLVDGGREQVELAFERQRLVAASVGRTEGGTCQR